MQVEPGPAGSLADACLACTLSSLLAMPTRKQQPGPADSLLQSGDL